jgi:hypothetical protein
MLKISERTELAFRSWALYDPIIKKHTDIIDRARIKYLYRIYRSILNNRKESLTKAYKTYFTFIGYQQLKTSCNKNFSKLLLYKLFDVNNL